jgi:hypothetical protein
MLTSEVPLGLVPSGLADQLSLPRPVLSLQGDLQVGVGLWGKRKKHVEVRG